LESRAEKQIYISYARSDDALPPDLADAKGFVTSLYEQLQYELKVLGEPTPRIWLDTRRIDLGDHFESVVENALATSDIFLVLLSRNWLGREFGRRELDLFTRRWREMGEDNFTVDHRIVVASLHEISSENRPPELQGQRGFDFFSRDSLEDIGGEQPFFARGKIQDER
jgi:hypothetical protein